MSHKSLKKLFDIYLVDSDEKLKSFVEDIINIESVIAIDLESDRNHRFGHNLSLIQVGTKNKQYVIDPLAFTENHNFFVKEFSKILTSDILKLFYSGIEDIQVLKRDFVGKIYNVFDVQVANGLLNGSLNFMVGLDKLIRQEFNLELPKKVSKLQRTDWSVRPLSNDMLEYASFDVMFLIDLFEKYNDKLKTHKLYPNYLRYFSSLELIEPVNEEIAELVRFMKMYNYDTLSELDLLLVYRIHQFRMNQGRQINRPSHFILSKSDITKILETKPCTLPEYDRLGIRKFKKNINFKNKLSKLIDKTIKEFGDDNTIFDQEVKPIIDLVTKLGRKDLYLVNKDLTLNLNVDLDIYKNRKFILTQWRKGKIEENLIHKELFLSSHVINALSNYIFKDNKLPDIPGLDENFKSLHNKEILKLLDDNNLLFNPASR